VRSGLTQMVRAIEGDESSIHAEFHEVISGQLRFLGSILACLNCRPFLMAGGDFLAAPASCRN